MRPELHPLLAQAAGPLLPWLLDDTVIEIRCTSSGAVFVLRFGQGKTREADVAAEDLDSFLAVLASHVGSEWRDSSPRLHAADPKLGFRVQASRPPVSPGIECVIRLHPTQVFPLNDFVQKQILTVEERRILEQALFSRQTILISGEVGSSKTSLLNSLTHALRDSPERLVVAEDDREVVSQVEETTFLRCVEGWGGLPAITMRDLCKDLLRLSPDRIIIGEVRDGAALDMLRAFQCGVPGLCTIHADGAVSTLQRLEQLILEVSATPQQALIGAAIDLICHMERYRDRWRATAIVEVRGWDGTAYQLRHLIQPKGVESYEARSDPVRSL
jgi:Flp pilus assembly CpaF family ATPase